MRSAAVRPSAVRLRTVVAGAVLAALVGSLGQPVAWAATPTPTEIQTLLNDAATTSRAEAAAGMSSTNTFGTVGPHVERYDATSQRHEGRYSGRIRIETATGVYYNRMNSKAVDAKVKKLAGRSAGTWIRTSRTDPLYGEEFNGVLHMLDTLFLSVRPESAAPDSGSAAAGPDGSTVYTLTWFSGSTSSTWTVSADGLVQSMRTTYQGGVVVSASFTYAPQTITLPTKTMGRRLYDRATEAYRMPSTVKALAKQVRLFTNEQPPSTVKEIRKWARKRRDEYNRYALLDAHVTNVRGGARIWLKNPFTGKVVSRRVVRVGGKAVVRR